MAIVPPAFTVFGDTLRDWMVGGVVSVLAATGRLDATQIHSETRTAGTARPHFAPGPLSSVPSTREPPTGLTHHLAWYRHPKCSGPVSQARGPLLEIVFQLLAPARMPQLAQRLGLDLPDALPGHPEALPHFFQRPLVPVDQAEAQLQHAALTRRERVQDVLHLGAKHGQRSGVRR